ncbi:hypothetical protein EC957_000419 [Mortierella hygrophila]|uniref:Fungal lipase-type domain-containing protein n=1 Tax=Mortierella hygrophila TaxID=979708 RepID=A0A9P6F7P9_9FUNG|nr:hypothetical protein EC957_000419 [Mortierella hygrophila]
MTWSVDCSSLEHQSTEGRPHFHVPEKYPIRECHLREFCGPTSHHAHDTKSTISSNTSDNSSSSTKGDKPLKEPIRIKPIDFASYLHSGLKEYIHNLRHPSTLPGKGPVSKVYALGLFPALVGILVFCQWVISLVILWSSYTTAGRKAFQVFLKEQILLFDPTDKVDPNGTREALKQLSDLKPKAKPVFNYYVTHLLLILSTLTYERNDELVKQAAEILEDIDNEEQRQQAADLLLNSEETIDRKAQLMGMRFEGVSELKSLGGPYAGLFYNEESIVLVFKGTSVLAFNEYLIDGTIQRVDAKEYLYGEVHKGFYESLFPDPLPLDETKHAGVNRTNPFQTIMETIFVTAKKLREKHGKLVNLWMTGHSLGGALAALTMARLQLPLRSDDPLFEGYSPDSVKALLHDEHGVPRTVLQEMISRFNSSHSGASSAPMSPSSSSSSSTIGSHQSTLKGHFGFLSHLGFHGHHDKKDLDDLINLRDCYSFASPKLGDTAFAKEFDQHHIQFMKKSTYKPVYYRVITDNDIVPMMPPSCSTDPDDLRKRLFPCVNCPQASSSEPHPHHSLASSLLSSKTPSYGATEFRCQVDDDASFLLEKPMNSLLDYRNVGQMIRLFNSPIRPLTKPSDSQTDLCEGLQRTDQELSELLRSIQETLMTQKAVEANDSSSPSTLKATSSWFARKNKNSKETAFYAQEVEKKMLLAKVKYDLDEESRLRMPCTGERIMLTFPFVISHSPATYQRNLVMARFYFESFPGVELEQKLSMLGGKGVGVSAGSARGSAVVDMVVVV